MTTWTLIVWMFGGSYLVPPTKGTMYGYQIDGFTSKVACEKAQEEFRGFTKGSGEEIRTACIEIK